MFRNQLLHILSFFMKNKQKLHFILVKTKNTFMVLFTNLCSFIFLKKLKLFQYYSYQI